MTKHKNGSLEAPPREGFTPSGAAVQVGSDSNSKNGKVSSTTGTSATMDKNVKMQ